MPFCAIVFAIPGLETERGEPTQLSGWIRLMVGAALLVLAVRQWNQRPSGDDPITVPKTLSRLDSASAGYTVVFGFLLSAVNPKTLLLTFAGAAAIDASMATPSQQAIALMVFSVVASLSVAIPIVAHNVFSEHVRTAMADCKDWLIRNNAGVVTVILIVFGALIIGNGLKIIST